MEFAIAAGIGAADIAIGQFGNENKVVGPLTAKDIFRLGVAGLGLAGSFTSLPIRERYTDVALYASVPLVASSAYRIAKETSEEGEGTARLPTMRLATSKVTSVPTLTAAPATAGKGGVIAY